MAPAPFAGPAALEFKQIIRVKGVAPAPNGGNNAREWWMVPNSSGGRPGSRPAIGAHYLYSLGDLTPLPQVRADDLSPLALVPMASVTATHGRCASLASYLETVPAEYLSSLSVQPWTLTDSQLRHSQLMDAS